MLSRYFSRVVFDNSVRAVGETVVLSSLSFGCDSLGSDSGFNSFETFNERFDSSFF